MIDRPLSASIITLAHKFIDDDDTGIVQTESGSCPASFSRILNQGSSILPFQPDMLNIDVKYTNDSGVPIEVRVLNVLVREDHHIRVHVWAE